ncbi:MAG: hypothetical protein HQL40_13865 [Alphaproteobacteria bacterium]|nr:hypothetical protein [Alphaproteobacteria bacterium]
MDRRPRSAPAWTSASGGPLDCPEKIKVLDQNLDEIREVCREAFEDAILMGCDEQRVREVLHGVIDDLRNPWPKPKGE